MEQTFKTFYEKIVQPLHDELADHPDLLREEFADQNADAILAALEKRQLIEREALEYHGTELRKAIETTLRSHRTVTAATVSRQLIGHYTALYSRAGRQWPVARIRPDGTPCYDNYESNLEQATVGLVGCIIASGGMPGVAVCSTVYAVSVILLDEDFEECLEATY